MLRRHSLHTRLIQLSESFRISTQHLSGAIQSLQHLRAVSVPILSEEFRLELLEEAKRYPLRYINNRVGSGDNEVRQEMLLQNELNTDGSFGQLVRHFQEMFDTSIAGCDYFEDTVVFNDWIIQKYLPAHLGITPHRDRTDYRHLICLFVLSGHGRFQICEDRNKSNNIEIVNLPGDVILMPGPGFRGMERRPYHHLDSITSERWIFGLRHDQSKIK